MFEKVQHTKVAAVIF